MKKKIINEIVRGLVYVDDVEIVYDKEMKMPIYKKYVGN